MKKSRMKATALRTVMRVIIFMIIVFSVVGFYFTQNWLSQYSIEANQTASGSVAGSNSPQALKQLRDEISKNQLYGDKANSMIASSQNYQDQIAKDLNKYASIAGVTIDGYNYAQPASVINASTIISGLKSNFVTITILNNPVPIKNLLQFFKLIENNLPKMQLMGINLTPSLTSNDAVMTDPLIIEVYTR